jgi:hypothetical protein
MKQSQIQKALKKVDTIEHPNNGVRPVNLSYYYDIRPLLSTDFNQADWLSWKKNEIVKVDNSLNKTYLIIDGIWSPNHPFLYIKLWSKNKSVVKAYLTTWQQEPEPLFLKPLSEFTIDWNNGDLFAEFAFTGVAIEPRGAIIFRNSDEYIDQ